MININLIVLGKIKENYFKDAINEYKKMLKSYADLSIFEIMDEPCPENLSDKDMEKVKKCGRRKNPLQDKGWGLCHCPRNRWKEPKLSCLCR